MNVGHNHNKKKLSKTHRLQHNQPKFASTYSGLKPTKTLQQENENVGALNTPSTLNSGKHNSPQLKSSLRVRKKGPTFFSSTPNNHSGSETISNDNIIGNRSSINQILSNNANYASMLSMQNRMNLNQSHHLQHKSTRSRTSSGLSSIGNTVRNKHNRENIVAQSFIHNEMTKIAYEKYIRSPFAFIDRIENGEIPPSEFVYLKEHAPYDLEIITSEDINKKNFYTLSSSGLTHFLDDEVIFTPLTRWQREYYLFSSMMNIPFFKKYRLWKTFKTWKKVIQTDKVNHCNQVMKNHLFILNPHLRQPLFEIRKLCCEIADWQIFKVDLKNPSKLEDFVIKQDKYRKDLRKKLQIIYEKIKQKTLIACETRLHAHLVDSGFRDKNSTVEDHRFKLMLQNELEDEDDSNDTNNDKFTFHSRLESRGKLRSKSKSVVSHAERAAIRTECRSLTKFIKMIDNFLQDSVMSLCRDRIKELLTLITRDDSQFKFNTNVTFPNDSVHIQASDTGIPDSTTNVNTSHDGVTSSAIDSMTNKKTTRGKKNKTKEQVPIFHVELELNDETEQLDISPSANNVQEAMHSVIQEIFTIVLHPPIFSIQDEDLQVFTQVLYIPISSQRICT